MPELINTTAMITAVITTPLQDSGGGYLPCLDHVLKIVVANEPHFKCNIHGEVQGYFKLMDMNICGKCAANAIEKFIKDMNNNNSTKGSPNDSQEKK